MEAELLLRCFRVRDLVNEQYYMHEGVCEPFNVLKEILDYGSLDDALNVLDTYDFSGCDPEFVNDVFRYLPEYAEIVNEYVEELEKLYTLKPDIDNEVRYWLDRVVDEAYQFRCSEIERIRDALIGLGAYRSVALADFLVRFL